MTIKVNMANVQELRSRTGAGVLECKKALVHSEGNIEKSIDYLRKIGYSNALKKMTNKTLQGSIFVRISNDIGVMVEINCQTDFVERSESFISFGQKVLDLVLLHKINDIQLLRNKCEIDRIKLISQVKENINIRRLLYINSKTIINYVHRGRIGVFIVTNDITKQKNVLLLREIAMHIAFSNPSFLTTEEISDEIINREYSIQSDIVKKMKKTQVISNKIVQGKMKKFKNQITLLEQFFIINPEKTVKQILKENNLIIKSFIRFEVGEMI